MILALIVFFVVLHYVEYIDDFMDRGATMREVFLVYYPSYVPDIVRLTSPLAVFLACVYLTARLAQQLQLAALQTSGVSLYRLLRPYLVVAVLLTGGLFYFNGWVVPETNRTVIDFERRYLKDAPRQLDINDLHRQNRPGSIVTVGYYDRVTKVGHRISLQEFAGENRLVRRIDAPRMQWIDSLQVWRLYQPVERVFEAGGADRVATHRDAETLDTLLNVLPRDLARTERDVETMTIREAAAYVEQLERTGAGDLGRPLVAYHTKFSYPVAVLVLTLIGVPLAARRRRGGQAVQIGLGLLVAFAYLAAQKLTEPFGYAGAIPPPVVAWAPHALFFGLALALLARARK